MQQNSNMYDAGTGRKVISVSVKRQQTEEEKSLANDADVERDLERKMISISVKRQLTIPLKFFNALGFSNEAECILQEDGLLIRPLRAAVSTEQSELILADLISQGYEGQQLLQKFKELSTEII